MTQAAESWADEMRSAFLYRIIARKEGASPRATLFAELANEAESQARVWADHARAAGTPVPERFAPDRRARIVAHMIERVGPRRMRMILAAMKVRGLSVYTHAVPGHPTPVSVGAMADRHGSPGSGGSLRAAVFGVNDGLISNCSLILGVAGANADVKTVLLTGAAGLLAGAFSMAAGEYVSVRSQREMFEHQIALERKELETYPDEEAEELALIYAARGMTDEEAAALARRTIADPERALDTLAREELGLNPDELGSPWGAALSSLAAFAFGALIPLLPFALASPGTALGASIAATAVALFVVGATISLFTGRNAVVSGLRMLAIGGAAGALTWGIGRMLGVSIG
jgi:VIT1/CCC1 family predicted Fe2+/Mn2+ transporter